MHDALTLLREFAELQANLLARSDADALRIVRAGEVECSGKWQFKRHGAGLTFTSKDGVIVSAHFGAGVPRGIDAWRLLRFCKSRGVPSLLYAGLTWAADDERALDRLLGRCAQDGVLNTVRATFFGAERELYVLP